MKIVSNRNELKEYLGSEIEDLLFNIYDGFVRIVDPITNEVSIGGYTVIKKGLALNQIIKKADEAMYEVKKRKKEALNANFFICIL